MRRRRKKTEQPILENKNLTEEKDDSISDYLYGLSNALCDKEDENSREEFDAQLSHWKEKWRQRPLEYWLKHYRIPSERKNDGTRDKSG